MLRRNIRLMNEKQENFFRMRHRRMAQSNLRAMGQSRHTGRVLADSISELNEMVEKIGKINLNKDSEPNPNLKPSVSEKNRKPTRGASHSTKPKENPIIETTCTWSMALLVSDGNVFTPVRGVLDSESQHHIISDKCRRKLKLPLVKLNPPPPNSAETVTKILGKTIVSFSSYFNRKRIFTVEAYVVDEICPLSPSMIVHPGIKRQLDFFKLSDPHFDFPAPVEMVIGSDLHPVLLKGRPCFVLGKSCCVLQSRLGWVVGGKVPIDEFQQNKTKDDTAEKLTKTIRDVEAYIRNTAESAK